MMSPPIRAGFVPALIAFLALPMLLLPQEKQTLAVLEFDSFGISTPEDSNLINRYNPHTHEGLLPVRVLSYNVIDWFENISPDFLEMAKCEIDIDGLQNAIGYSILEAPIKEVPHIDTNHKIQIYENFNQYLWSICYALYVIHQNVLEIPIQVAQANYSAYHNASNASLAIQVLDAGLDLLENFDANQFYNLPNPERYAPQISQYIEKTNGLYCAGMGFILTHEFAHQFYGHLMPRPRISDEVYKKEEFFADEFALDQMRASFTGKNGTTNKVGLIAALASMIFLDSSLKGGSEHPDPDDRLINLLDKMDLAEKDGIWGLTGLVYYLWIIHYHPGHGDLTDFTSTREFHDKMLLTARNLKKT